MRLSRNLADARNKITRCQNEYNGERRHSSLEYRTSNEFAEVLKSSVMNGCLNRGTSAISGRWGRKRWKPDPEVWTAMDSLSHITEFVPYWTAQIEQVIQNPDRQWGRTHHDPDRLATVAD